MSEDLSFILTSLLTRRANRLIIRNITQANDSSTALSELASRYRVTSSIRRLVTDALVLPLWEAILSMARLTNVRIECLGVINRLVRLDLLCLALMSGSNVIRITALSRIDLRR